MGCFCHPCSALAVMHLLLHLVTKVNLVRTSCVLVLSLTLQLSAMDVLARTMMKGAAKCDEHCELQNSVNQ